MALIKCPECGKEISDKAESCIYCGYPLKENKVIQPVQEEKKPLGNQTRILGCSTAEMKAFKRVVITYYM